MQKLFFHNNQSTKNNKLKRFLGENHLVHSGLAGDLISCEMFHGRKTLNFMECSSQTTTLSFNEKLYVKSASTASSSEPQVNVCENEKNNLLSMAINDMRLKDETALQQVPQVEVQEKSSFATTVRDQTGIKDRRVPESHITAPNHSHAQTKKANATEKVPEPLLYSAERNKKWKNMKIFTEEHKLKYRGFAGDLISSITEPNLYLPKNLENKGLKVLSQPIKASDDDFIFEINKNSQIKHMIPEEFKSSTPVTIINKAKPIPNKETLQITRSYKEYSAQKEATPGQRPAMQCVTVAQLENKAPDSLIHHEASNSISKDDTFLFNSVTFSDECSLTRTWQWEELQKYINKQQWAYGRVTVDLISCTSDLDIHKLQRKHNSLQKSVSQSQEYVCNTDKTLFKNKELSISEYHYTTSNEVKINMSFSTSIIAPDDKETETIRGSQINNSNKNSDIMFNALGKYCKNENHIFHDIPCEAQDICTNLQEDTCGTEDQAVPTAVHNTDHDFKENPCTIMVPIKKLPLETNYNIEIERMSPDIFDDQNNNNCSADTSLYIDSVERFPSVNVFSNTDAGENVERILNSEHTSVQQSENAFENINSDFINDSINMAFDQNAGNASYLSKTGKNTQLKSFGDQHSTEDEDYLYSLDIFPICLTQPAIPTYLIRSNLSEPSQNNSISEPAKTHSMDSTSLVTTNEKHQQEKRQENPNMNFKITHHYITENKTGCKDSNISATSNITSCNIPDKNTSLFSQDATVSINESNNFKDLQKEKYSSTMPDFVVTFEDNTSISNSYQNNKVLPKSDQIRIPREHSDEVHTINKSRYYKNDTGVVQHDEIQLQQSSLIQNHQQKEHINIEVYKTTSDNIHKQKQSYENNLNPKHDIHFDLNTFLQLDLCKNLVSVQDISSVDKQTHTENSCSKDLVSIDHSLVNHKLSNISNDAQSNQILPVQKTSEYGKHAYATEKQSPNNSFMYKNYLETSHKNHSSLIQHSHTNSTYLDIAHNLSNGYSLSSVKEIKNDATDEEFDRKVCKELDDNANSFNEEYDSDINISESNFDLHIEDAINKYQNASSDTEITLRPPNSQEITKFMDISLQTDISGLINAEQCICKKFQFHCEFCNKILPDETENRDKRKHMALSDLEMPVNKKSKCYNEELSIRDSTSNYETQSKPLIPHAEKLLEDSSFNKGNSRSGLVTSDYKCGNKNSDKQYNVQDAHKNSQLFTWSSTNKTRSAQGSQEGNEQHNKLKPKSLRIGLSKKAKTRPLHYNCNSLNVISSIN